MDGARVWLSIPADLANAAAGFKNLSFTLGTQVERLGSDAGAPQIWHPVFATALGWQLRAHGDDSGVSDAVETVESLTRQGDRLYIQATGLPWVPTGYTLIAPDATRYRLDTRGKVSRIRFADGARWLVSDAGITAVSAADSSSPAGRIDFLRDAEGRISRITYPDAHGASSALAYRYGSDGNLTLVRRFDDTGLGTPIAYSANGQPVSETLTANLGAVVNWNNGSANTWSGTLNADQSVTLAFAVRDSEIASTIHTPGGQGAVIVAFESALPDNTVVEVSGAQIIGTTTVNNGKVTRLLRVTEAGVKLIRISGAGFADIRLSLAGDLNRDGAVDGADASLWEQARIDLTSTGDINGDGLINAADRQVLYANSGFKANQAPVAVASLPSINTHADLSKNLVLTGVAQDLEGDQLFWRVLSATNGTAKLSADGLTLLFTSEPGYTGPASVTLQADDGFTAGRPIALAVNVSNAKLLTIRVNDISHLATGQTVKVKATVDFADEKEVVIDDAAYLTLRQAPLDTLGYVGNGAALKIDDGRDLLRAQAAGAGLVLVQRVDSDGRLVQAALSVNVQAAPMDGQSQNADGAPLFIAPDAYPGTLTLLPGTTRQLKVHMVNLNTGVTQDIAGATQTEFAGKAEETITETDPYSGEFLTDPVTGEILTGPVTGEYLIDPSTLQTITYTIPAQPAVYSGTRYVVSDESIASVSADGLITAHQAGQVQIFVVHLASVVDSNGQVREQILGRTVITLKVQAPQVVNGAAGIAVSARDGGAVQAATGETVLIGAGALRQDTQVAIERINLADLQSVTGMSPPAPNVLQAVGSFKLQVGNSLENLPLQLAIPLQDGNVQPGDEVVFFKKGQVTQADGSFKDTWWLVDNGYVGSDGIARTASPPYSGVSESGEYLVTRKIPDVIGSAGFSGTAGSWLDFTGTGVSQSLTGAAIGSDIIGVLATMATSVSAGRYHFGVPQFVEVDMAAIPADQRGNIDVGHYLPPLQSPAGQIALPNIGHAEVTDQGEFKISVDNPNPGQYTGHLELHMVFDNGSSRKVGGNLSGDFNAALTVNPADHEHTAIGKVRWQVVRVVDNPELNGSGSITQGKAFTFGGNLVKVTPKPNMAAVLTRTGIDIVREVDQSVVHSINLLEELGKNNLGGDYLTGTKVQPVVFSTDLSTIYVAGKGKIYEIDTLTYQPIGEIDLHSSSNIASLATAGDLLVIGEAGSTGSRLLVTYIDPGRADFHHIVSIKNTGIEQAPRGVSGLVIGPDGKTLIVGAPRQGAGVSLGDPSKRGDLLILDLATLDLKTGKIAVPIQAVLPADGISGKAPQVVSATQDPDRYLVSNIADFDRGLSTLTLKRDAQGRIVQASLNAINLSQPANAVRIDRLDIQRAQSAVLVVVDGVEYAIVGDDNYHFLDPYWKAMYEVPNFVQTSPFGPPTAVGGSAAAKKVNVGGKLGIIQDPFGKNGQPVYLGATLPLDGYGIVNLSVSPDSKVLLGQLKGGYSGDMSSEHWLTPYAQQTHAWNVKALIEAALAMPAQDRLSKHIVVTGDAEQLVNQDQGYPAGSFFDEDPNLKVTGRMGDIIELDLKRLVALKLLGLPTPDTTLDAQTRSENDLKIQLRIGEVNALIAKLEVSLVAGELSKVAGSDKLDSRGFNVVTKTGLTGAKLEDPNAILYSRNDAGVATDFNNTARLYLAPNLGGSQDSGNMDSLRAGLAVMPKTTQLNISYTVKVPVGYVQAGTKQLSVQVTAKDYDKGQAQFIGDRDLANPGYSDFTNLPKTLQFIGGISANSPNNDRLSVAWIEQRLKYLGYAKLDGNGKPDPTNEIQVNGRFSAAEQAALKQFEAIVRQGSAVGVGHDDNHIVEVKYQATVKIDGSVELKEVPGSLTVIPNDLNSLQLMAAAAQAVDRAKQQALISLGNLNATGNNGVDGNIESVSENTIQKTQRETTLSWLNAYNSPHWMQYFLNASGGGYQQTNYFLPGWVNKQADAAGKVFGTSWLFDLMLATQQANRPLLKDTIFRPNSLWFSGTNSLGTQLNLGINTNYISGNYQKGIYGDEWLIGLSDVNSIDLKNLIASNAANATVQQKLKYLLEEKDRLQGSPDTASAWNAQKAQRLADLLQYINRVVPPPQSDGTASFNDQTNALKDFLAVYNATQKGANGGGWNNLNVVNDDPETIRTGLFGEGSQTGGMIDQNRLLLGGKGIGSKLDADSLAATMNISKNTSAPWVAAINQALTEADIDTPQRVSMFLANVAQETDQLRAIAERYNNPPGELQYFNQKYGPNTAKGQELGNATAQEASNYRGRGFLHITGHYNYEIATFGYRTTAPNQKYISFNEWQGTQQTQTLASVGNLDGTVTVTGTIPPGWSIRIEFPKDGTATREFGYFVDSGNTGTFTISSRNQRAAGDVTATVVKYNFLENYKLLSDTNKKLVAAEIGAWYWRFERVTASNNYWDLNQRAADTNNFNESVRKINNGELSPGNTNYQARISKYNTVDAAIKSGNIGNAYGNISDMLKILGITSTTESEYKNKFGIILNQRTAIPITQTQHLLATSNGQTGDVTIDSRELYEQFYTEFDINESNDMIFIAAPDLPPTPVAPLLLTVAEQSNTKRELSYGVCRIIPPTSKEIGGIDVQLGPQFMAYRFLPKYIQQRIDNNTLDYDLSNLLVDFESKVRITRLQEPKHGNIQGKDIYKPNDGYIGKDQVEYLLEGNDLDGKPFSVKVKYYINVVPNAYNLNYEKALKKYCGTDKGSWKIITPELSSLPNDFSADLTHLSNLTFANLPGSTLAQTTGTGLNAQITLDTDAAGYGWFIDNTPSLTEEFLPTSNPYEWVAKAGSEAAGKMDMLSVWLHELGHALGLDHSSDSGNFMASTLQPGKRRLPTAEELAWLTGWGLVPTTTPASSASPASLSAIPLDPNAPSPAPWPIGTSLAAFVATRNRRGDRSAMDSAANPTLTNPEFAPESASASGNAAIQWDTQGTVDFSAGSATLHESASRQTRLSQAFVVGPNDRFLSFTLSGAALDDMTGAPDDAFEVALLDANSGLSLLGGTGLSRNDAFLNLQADGTEYKATGVTTVKNADGSRTVLVDLAGIAAGTVVNLSFDLIGFGRGAAATSSHVTVKELHLGVPQEAHDDAATLDEDATLDVDVIANDIGADQPGVLPILVSGPTHGTVEITAEGRFRCRPDANWSGEDSFSYRLSDGKLDSNVALVKLTVTPVNDAPVIAPQTVTLGEDSSAIIKLLQGATDVDGDMLTATVTTAPQHGSLTQNADGTWTYTPNADWNGTDVVRYQVTDGQAVIDTKLSFVVAAVNDAPLAQDLAASVDEDGGVLINPLARAFDIDGDALTRVIDSGPVHGMLTLNADQSLIYHPDADWSGEDGFSYHFNDGELDSAPASVKITVNPVADAPALVLTKMPGATRELFRTGWETADNKNRNPSRIHADTLEGWTSIEVSEGAENEHSRDGEDRDEGQGEGRRHPDFLVWSNGDRLGGNDHRRTEVYAAPGNGENWLALNGPQEDQHHAQGIERRLATVAGASYTLSLDFAAGLGASSGVLIYIDGVRIGGGQASSPDDALAWRNQSWHFTGAGGVQMLRIVADTAGQKHPAALMLDDIALSETLPSGSGWEDQSVALPQLAVALKDRDGSESLNLRLEALPVGAELTDGLRRFTATLQSTGVDITGWNLSQLCLTPPKDFFGAFEIGVVATATECANQDAAETRAVIALQILAVNDAPVAENASYTLNKDGSVRIDFTGLVSDIDGTVLTLQLGKPGKGTLTRNADGSYTYKPKHGYTGSDRFSYTVSDGELTASATINLSIVAAGKGGGDDDRRASSNCITLWSGLAPSSYRADSFIVQRNEENGIAASAPDQYPITIDWNGATGLVYTPQDQWLAAYLKESEAAPASLAEITGLVFPVGDK